MKLYISSDIEGTAGIATWEETTRGKAAYEYFAEQMSREVAAACEGAFESGKVSDILVRDAHDSACNIIPSFLPRGVQLMRSWECAPAGMMSGVNLGYDAAAMTGYHSAAYTDGNPLAHTSNTKNQYIRINGMIASEFLINTWYAAYCGVPVIFLSGDEAQCEEAGRLVPEITTVPVSKSFGGASISIHPMDAADRIREGMQSALTKDVSLCRISLPSHFHTEIEFREYASSCRGSYYPGAVRVGTKGLEFDTDDYYEVVRFLYFVL